MAAKSFVDVLIIGAGPSGLMCATGLARAGINVKIVDQRPLKIAAGQADGIQPRTLEILHSYDGLGERFLREGIEVHMAAFYNPSPNGGIERTGKSIDVPASTARFPFEFTLGQGNIEAIFLDAMVATGLKVDRPVKPSSIEISQDEAELKDHTSYPVRVVLEHLNAPEGDCRTEIIKAKYVVGADGAHSWVRKCMGIKMEGEQTESIWGVIDASMETNFPDFRCKAIIHSEDGSSMIIPREGDLMRMYVQLGDTDNLKDAIDSDTRGVNKVNTGPNDILEVAVKTVKPYKLDCYDVTWWTVYITGQRVASAFCAHERVFIVGDACHTHSPNAGQGMNAGMNDSHNLLWKLAHVIRGWADSSILKTYELERRKFAQDLIAFDRKWFPMVNKKAKTSVEQNGVTHEELLEAFRTFSGLTSGVRIYCSPSVITNPANQSIASDLRIGERLIPQIVLRAADAKPIEIQDLCPADTRFRILIFAGDLMCKQQTQRLDKLAATMGAAEGFLNKFGRPYEQNHFRWDGFEILTICSGKKEIINFMDVPPLFRSHWTKVFLDDVNTTGTQGGKAYSTYGIDSCMGAIVVLRPDGYIGAIASIENISHIENYFSAFMKPSA